MNRHRITGLNQPFYLIQISGEIVHGRLLLVLDVDRAG